MASFAQARARGGDWLVRMEDLDRSREVRGAAGRILRALDAFGLAWDGEVMYQSTRSDRYAERLHQLRQLGLIYPCACSRRLAASDGRPGPDGPIYSGRCRDGLRDGRQPRSERVKVGPEPIAVADRIHGIIEQRLDDSVGDFVVRRADGIHAYQLAVVVDDADQGIDQVVRGADLLMSTPRQVYLQRCLGLPRPSYAHVPLAVDSTGRKLSKSLAALPVDPKDPIPALLRVWQFLGQRQLESRPTTTEEFWGAAIARWRIADVPRRRTIDISGVCASPATPDRIGTRARIQRIS